MGKLSANLSSMELGKNAGANAANQQQGRNKFNTENIVIDTYCVIFLLSYLKSSADQESG